MLLFFALHHTPLLFPYFGNIVGFAHENYDDFILCTQYLEFRFWDYEHFQACGCQIKSMLMVQELSSHPELSVLSAEVQYNFHEAQ